MITQSDIGEGDRLGAQMGSLASLFWLSKETGHEVVFHREVRHASNGLMFLDAFDLPIRILPHNRFGCLSRILFAISRPIMQRFWTNLKSPIYRILRLAALATTRIAYRLLRFQNRSSFVVPKIPWCPRLNCDPILVSLLKAKRSNNFDIPNGRLGSYQDWKNCENEIVSLFKFKKSIVSSAKEQFAHFYADSPLASLGEGRETVAVHFRLTDYLLVSSLNLTIKYYQEALSHFPSEKFNFLVFSDDIERCKRMPLFEGRTVIFVDDCSAAMGMCLMSLCDHAIIANSSYSFWGAMLNCNPCKRVICPREFAGTGFPANGLWYPEAWTSVPILP